jgi:UDP-MurNAc hydroxylase
MPGDSIELVAAPRAVGRSWIWHKKGAERLEDSNLEDYIRKYASDFAPFFEARAKKDSLFDPEAVHDHLFRLLAKRLSKVSPSVFRKVDSCMYWVIEELPARVIRVDWKNLTVETKKEVDRSSAFYSLTASAGQYGRLLEGSTGFGEFVLTMRQKLERQPDVFYTPVSGFLRTEDDDLQALCDTLDQLQRESDRICVSANGQTYEINRYCPHQGADLTVADIRDGRFIVCPRHGWTFDLENGGRGTNNAATISATKMSKASVTQ